MRTGASLTAHGFRSGSGRGQGLILIFLFSSKLSEKNYFNLECNQLLSELLPEGNELMSRLGSSSLEFIAP